MRASSRRGGARIGHEGYTTIQRVATLNVGDTFIAEEDLGAVDWRAGGAGTLAGRRGCRTALPKGHSRTQSC